MSGNNHKEIQRLFLQALEAPEADRAEWLTQACGDDHALLQNVLELLAHADDENDPLEAGVDRAFAAVLGDEPAAQTKDWDKQAEPEDGESIPDRIGRYEVRSQLGQGGFGDVFEAFDPSLQRMVAVKIPRSEMIHDQAARDLYLTEARAVAQLDHPHIVPIHDVGQFENRCFLVSKLIKGSSLRQSLSEGKMEQTTAIRIALQVAQALGHAHERGIFHRDIKPDNILLDRAGDAHLTDFGIALSEDRIGSGPRVTGTLAYMSPEQVRGDSHLVDGRADIYSLGVVLYELLCGKRPFTAPTYTDLKRQICDISPRPLRSIDATIPTSLERLCNKAMSKSPDQRYQTAEEFNVDLQAELARAPQSTSLKSSIGWVRPLIVGGCALTLLIAVSLAFSSWSGFRTTSSNAEGSSTAQTPIEVERFQIEVWGPGRDGESIQEVMPIRSGDAITFDIKLSRAAYAYLYWIDTEGEPTRLFPPASLEQDAVKPVRVLRSPSEYQKGWPVIGGAGMETAVLLVRDTPLSSTAEVEARLRLPERKTFNTARETIVYKLDETRGLGLVAAASQRGLGSETVAIDRPVLSMIDSLKDDFAAIQAIRIAHQELLPLDTP